MKIHMLSIVVYKDKHFSLDNQKCSTCGGVLLMYRIKLWCSMYGGSLFLEVVNILSVHLIEMFNLWWCSPSGDVQLANNILASNDVVVFN